LDLDVYKFSKEIKHSKSDSILAKAILYRFYKHVHLINEYYVCDIKDPRDIKITNSVFLPLIDNLEEMNAGRKRAKEKGQKMGTFEVDDKYLNSLLN
jgi:hypothetical protein